MNDIRTQMREALLEARTIAVVGASDKANRPVYGVMKFLQQRGYRCIPVSPRLAGAELLGETVYASLDEIPVPFDMADLFVNSTLAGEVTDDAIAAGAKTVWMQLGVVDETAARRARDAGLRVIMDRCPAQEWARLDLPDRIDD